MLLRFYAGDPSSQGHPDIVPGELLSFKVMWVESLA